MIVEFSLTCVFHHVLENFLKSMVFSWKSECFENLCPPTAERGGAERGGESYALLYQNSIRKYEDELEHWVIYIL